MKDSASSKKGFTLIEVILSTIISVIIFVGPIDIFARTSYNISYARHKLQSAYLAQDIIEKRRRYRFADLTTGTTSSQNITIDTKGTGTTADDLIGNYTVTISTVGTYRKRVQVKISWVERTFAGTINANEYYTTDIADEPEIN